MLGFRYIPIIGFNTMSTENLDKEHHKIDNHTMLSLGTIGTIITLGATLFQQNSQIIEQAVRQEQRLTRIEVTTDLIDKRLNKLDK